MRHQVELCVNGIAYAMEVASQQTLIDALRMNLGIKSVKRACGGGECGACTVILNGDTVCSCLMLAVEANGADIITVEALEDEEGLHPLQEAFLEHGAMQCGFCTSGMLMSAWALLNQVSRPSDEEIRAGMSGNICRCAGYANVIKSVQTASRARRQG